MFWISSIVFDIGKEKNMPYLKPSILASSGKNGSFAAGCPADTPRYRGDSLNCRNCERTA